MSQNTIVVHKSRNYVNISLLVLGFLFSLSIFAEVMKWLIGNMQGNLVVDNVSPLHMVMNLFNMLALFLGISCFFMMFATGYFLIVNIHAKDKILINQGAYIYKNHLSKLVKNKPIPIETIDYITIEPIKWSSVNKVLTEGDEDLVRSKIIIHFKNKRRGFMLPVVYEKIEAREFVQNTLLPAFTASGHVIRCKGCE